MREINPKSAELGRVVGWIQQQADRWMRVTGARSGPPDDVSLSLPLSLSHWVDAPNSGPAEGGLCNAVCLSLQ